jgi:phosphoribosyl 1,2-cyclic phosphodiesterase
VERRDRATVRLTVLGSGSRGNALLVESAGRALLVDAGFSLVDLERRCAAAGRDPAAVRAIALTHEHGDHARGAARAAAAWGVPVAASPGTLERLSGALRGGATIALPASRATVVDAFLVTAFPTAHDASDPVMLVVEDPEGRRLGVAYDLGSPTTALLHACRGLDALVIEANHDEVMLRASAYPPAVRSRIAGRGGHLSNRQAAAVVAGVVHAGLSVVVLAHLSDRCNRPALAVAALDEALRGTAFAGRVVVAGQDAPTSVPEVGAALTQLVLPLPRSR